MSQQQNSDKRIPLSISVFDNGMITIDDIERKHIAYGNIDGMYQTETTQGVTLSLNSMDRKNHEQVMTKCNEIASACYELQKMLGDIDANASEFDKPTIEI